MATINGVRLTCVGHGVAMRRAWNEQQARKRQRGRAAAELALEAADDGREADASVVAAATVVDGPIGEQRYDVRLRTRRSRTAASADTVALDAGTDALGNIVVAGSGEANAGRRADVLLNDAGAAAAVEDDSLVLEHNVEGSDLLVAGSAVRRARASGDSAPLTHAAAADVQGAVGGTLEGGALETGAQDNAALGGESLFERLVRADRAAMSGRAARRTLDDVVAVAIQNVPPLVDGQRDVSNKLRTNLTTVDNAWLLFLDDHADIEAAFAANSYCGPTYQVTVQWAKWLLTTREADSFAAPDLMGRSFGTVEVYLKHAKNHLWRARYAGFVDMPQSAWHAYWSLVHQSLTGFFTDEGRTRWANAAAEEARAVSAERGESESMQEAYAADARQLLVRGLAAAKKHPMARDFASVADLYLVQDVLLSEPFQVAALRSLRAGRRGWW